MQKYKKNGFESSAAMKFAAILGHRHRAAGVAGQETVEVIDRFRSDVVLADASGAVTGGAKQYRQGFDVVVRAEMVVAVLVPVLGVGMVEQPGQDHRAAGAATGRRAEGEVEPRAVGRQSGPYSAF